jgi:endonuclease/exonuclease/phosphatase family metal-dependent hydrolase
LLRRGLAAVERQSVANVLRRSPATDRIAPLDLRVATFNIRHGARSDGIIDHEALVEDCRSLGADVLALQEVDRGRARSDRVDQSALVGRALGHHAVYGPVLRRSDGGHYGNALLTSGPLHDVELMQLPRPSSREPRGAIFATAEFQGMRFSVVATHLQHHPAALRHLPAEAAVQLTALAHALRDWPWPRVLLGDLNLDTPRAHALLVDARYQVRASEPTFPADEPRLTLDHVAVDGFDIVDVEVVATTVSDHRALVATLRSS